MIRILVPYMLSFGGGVQRVLCEGLPELERSGRLRVEYAELADNENEMRAMELRGVPVVRGLGPRGSGILSSRSGPGRAFDYLLAIPRVLRIIRRLSKAARSYDVLYVHGYRELVLASAAAAFLGRRRPALVWHCHGLGDGPPPPMMAKLANACERVIGVSNNVVQGLLEIGVASTRLRTVYNAVRRHQVPADPGGEPSLPAGHGKTILVASASLRSIKGAHLVLEALARLPETTGFWLTGDTQDELARGYTATLVNRAAELGVRGRFHLLGRRSDLVDVMRQADVVAVPSLCREGFGLVAAEAMLLRKPVVVSNRGGLPEVVGSPGNGWIFDPDVPGDLNRCLLEALGDRERVPKVVQAAFERASTLYSYDRWAMEVCTALQEAARLRAAGPVGTGLPR